MFLYIIIKNARKNTSTILALISDKHNNKINIIDNGKFEDWRLKMKANLEKMVQGDNELDMTRMYIHR